VKNGTFFREYFGTIESVVEDLVPAFYYWIVLKFRLKFVPFFK